MYDPIVEEVRKHREEILPSYGSGRACHTANIEEQKQYGNRLVSMPPMKSDTKPTPK